VHHTPTSWRRYAGDMLRDRDLVIVNRLFPVWCLASLALPFGVGWFFGGVAGGLTALLWAGGVRICLLHHVTWSINSICHTIGKRPFVTGDKSTNVGALALVSFGESWHNGHHAFPRSARHGILRHQYDSSAVVISLFERLGWATNVRRAATERR
jgi:stearoyl-CoA desaturase (Delta-9 desaturase)